MSDAGVFADRELAEFMAGPQRPSPRSVGVEATRAGGAERAASRPPGPEIAIVTDLELLTEPSTKARLYRPSADPRPTVVYFHGGGWTIGSLDTHDALCRRFAALGDVSVLSVDYRLAPEHPWPAAVEDAVAATRVALDHPELTGGTGAVAVSGDSAGGHLAALVALALRGRLAAQFLIYPNTDLTFSQPSVIEKGTGFGLQADDALYFAEQWVPDAERRGDPAISPLFAPDLAGAAPALVTVAEHDPLRDEGAAYAARLAEQGVDVTCWCEEGLVHGFMSMDLVSPAAKAAGDRIFRQAGRLLAGA